VIVGDLMVLISGNNAMLSGTLAKSEAELKTFSAGAGTHAGAASNHLATVGLVAGGVAAATALMGAASIKAAADFQDRMAVINTIAHQTPDELEKTGLAIRRLSAESGQGLPDLTQGFYDLLSAGVPVGNAMEILRNATTLARGGLATTSETVDLLTSAINSYHLTTKGAGVATDQFALAVQDGKVTAAQIASSFADVAPLAHQAGVGIDEISASYAFLTAQGVQPSEAMTQMNRAMIELLKPGKDLASSRRRWASTSPTSPGTRASWSRSRRCATARRRRTSRSRTSSAASRA
jgi:hypothetical protein